jgi:hypothetical protein
MLIFVTVLPPVDATKRKSPIMTFAAGWLPTVKTVALTALDEGLIE